VRVVAQGSGNEHPLFRDPAAACLDNLRDDVKSGAAWLDESFLDPIGVTSERVCGRTDAQKRIENVRLADADLKFQVSILVLGNFLDLVEAKPGELLPLIDLMVLRTFQVTKFEPVTARKSESVVLFAPTDALVDDREQPVSAINQVSETAELFAEENRATLRANARLLPVICRNLQLRQKIHQNNVALSSALGAAIHDLVCGAGKEKRLLRRWRPDRI